VVTLDGTQTLTNKTLTAPTIASANLTTALTLAGAAGTNGQVLTSAGSGLPSWTTPSAGALVYLSTVTASAASTVDIETTFNSTYDVYEIIGSNILVSSDGASLAVRMKIGGTYESSSNYHGHFMSPTSALSTYLGYNSNAAAQLTAINAIRSGASRGTHLAIRVYSPSSTVLTKHIEFRASSENNAGNESAIVGDGYYDGTSALTGIRLYPSAGTITGTFRLYGIVKS
jgi:hypothetical protein